MLKKFFQKRKRKKDITSLECDDLILVSNDGKYWLKRHFAWYHLGKYYAWTSGTTSWTSCEEPIGWKYAKPYDLDGAVR